MTETKFATRVPVAPSFDKEAYDWYMAFARSQHDYMKSRGRLREAMLVHSNLIQEECCGGEATKSYYRRAMPDAEAYDCIMRAISGSLRGLHSDYVLSKLNHGYGCLSGEIKRNEENPRDPLMYPLAYVDIGMHHDLIDLCEEIEKKVQPVNDSVIELLEPCFKASEESTLEAHTFMAEELGLGEGGSYSQVLEAAQECGLAVLPIDAPLLLLMRPMELFGEDKYIAATEPIGGWLLQLSNSKKGLDLEARQMESRYGPKTRFIFRRHYSKSEE